MRQDTACTPARRIFCPLIASGFRTPSTALRKDVRVHLMRNDSLVFRTNVPAWLFRRPQAGWTPGRRRSGVAR